MRLRQMGTNLILFTGGTFYFEYFVIFYGVLSILLLASSASIMWAPSQSFIDGDLRGRRSPPQGGVISELHDSRKLRHFRFSKLGPL